MDFSKGERCIRARFTNGHEVVVFQQNCSSYIDATAGFLRTESDRYLVGHDNREPLRLFLSCLIMSVPTAPSSRSDLPDHTLPHHEIQPKFPASSFSSPKDT